MNLENIKYIFAEPDYSSWNYLRSIAGWKAYSLEIYNQIIESSLCFLIVLHNDKIIGMGRLVGDNITSFYIQGVVVIPSYQGQGIGTAIVKKLSDYAKQKAIEGGTIHLFAHKGTEPFYKRCGFQELPNSYKGAGMLKNI